MIKGIRHGRQGGTTVALSKKKTLKGVTMVMVDGEGGYERWMGDLVKLDQD